MSDTSNVNIGACSVTFGGTDLGHTKGGVVVTYSPEYADLTVDQYGNTPFDKALVGEVVTVKVPLAETQVSNINKAIPLSTLTGSSNGRATVGKEAGARLGTLASELVLHPISNSVSDLSDDVVFHKAVVQGEVEIGYNNEDERVVEVEFVALVDTGKSDGNLLGHFGDSTD